MIRTIPEEERRETEEVLLAVQEILHRRFYKNKDDMLRIQYHRDAAEFRHFLLSWQRRQFRKKEEEWSKEER